MVVRVTCVVVRVTCGSEVDMCGNADYRGGSEGDMYGSEGDGCGSNHDMQFGMYMHICAVSMSPLSVSCQYLFDKPQPCPEDPQAYCPAKSTHPKYCETLFEADSRTKDVSLADSTSTTGGSLMYSTIR